MLDFFLSNVDLNTLWMWISLILCLSVTVGGVLLMFRERSQQRHASIRYLQLHLILMYVYGYYSIWSGIWLVHLSPMADSQIMATLLEHLGAPFMVGGQVSFLLWAVRSQSQHNRMLLLPGGLIAAGVLLSLLAAHTLALDTLRVATAATAVLTGLAVTVMVVASKQPIVQSGARLGLYTILVGGTLIHAVLQTPWIRQPILAGLIVLAFFVLKTLLAFWVLRHSPQEQVASSNSLADFLLMYGISKREADVLKGINAGLTNQEIANQLFISLQTVKDHSSRLYQKTGAKNRSQLITRVRDSQAG